MELDGTKDSEFQGTKEIHERSQMKNHLKKAECDNTASSTSDESYPTFEFLYENIYLGNKKKRVNKEIRRMSCDCPFNPEEHDFVGCGEDCLNRLLMIECNSRCPCGEFCSNRKFQKGQKVKVEAFKTLKKGWGLRTSEDISANQFVMEYCGEVMGYEEFEKRVETYDKENRRHYYFMTLRADEIIDATHKGNLSRFINHSCNPNCETQKWTVNGYLRIGFFSMEDIKAGTELTFDYKFQRYGKKAQACYCDSLNCRGIIGGEKHTPLKSIISGRAASPVSTSSPRRSQRRSLAEQFDDKPLEIEIAQLLGGETGIKSDEQALKLSQFMVRAETPSQRLLLLDTLLATEDQNCLRSFVRYQGLSLLWSWMVDLRENSQRVPKKIVQVLKHLPVANLNQVQDSKVLKVVCKWARKPSVTIAPEEETSSSDLDSRGFSPLELMDDIVKRQGKISASCAGTAADDLQYMSESKNLDTHSAVNESIGVPGTKIVETLEKDARTLNEEQEREYEKVEESEAEKPDEFKDNVNDFEGCELKTASVTQGENLSGLVDDTPRTEDSSSEESRWSEDDSASTDSENIRDLATDLLESWSNLKEVYRIPKKSTNVEKREPESTSSTSGSVEAVVTEPSNLRRVVKIPPIPTIEGDLFQKDEFLSKLGERKLVEQKPGELESTENSTEIPALMGSALTKSDSEDSTRDTGKLPIHQRLQMVACGGGNPPKQYPVWHGKGNRKARKHPYHAGGGSFQPGIEKWGARHQATSKSRFNSPTNHPSNQPMHPGVCGPPRPNVPGNQWQEQNAPPYPGPYQFPPGSGPRSSTPVGYPTPNPNHPTAPPQPMQSSYFVPGAQHNQTGSDTRFQGPYPTQASHGLRPASAPPNPSEQSSFGPGLNPLPGQPGIQTNPRGYQQIQQPINPTLFPLPPFDPSQPPPNFVPSKSNVSSQQFPNAAQPQFGNTSSHTQFSNASSQFSSTPPSYSTPPSVPNVPSYPLQPPQAKQQVVSQRSPPPDLEQSQAVGTQLPSNAVSTTSLVNSTVNENARETLNRSTTDISSNSDRWSADPLSKPRDVSLPPGWKMAYDGEGRAYYYHVVTRQTQWELPTTDRSPPTPELGYLGDELDASVEMTTAFHSQNDVVMEEVGTTKRKKPKTPSTPPGSPPTSPVGKYTTAAADSTDVRKGLYSPSVLLQARHLTPEQRKLRETFRMKLSAVVVNYLNPYHKLDCKIGRITTVDDFKFLARKLTHGVMVKELSRLKDENELACNDSVKIKTKEYIRQYMQKFGPVYKPS